VQVPGPVEDTTTVSDAPQAAGDEPLRAALLRSVPVALETYAYQRLGQHASAICYRMLISLVPLSIVLVAIFGIFLRDADLQTRVVDAIVDFLPFDESSRQEVEDAIVAIASPASLLGFVALIAFGWTATGLLGAIRVGLEAALDVRVRRPAVRSKLVDAAGVIGAALLVIVLVVTGAVGNGVRAAIDDLAAWLGVPLPDLGLDAGSRVVEALVAYLVVLALYRFVPARRLRGSHLLVGAATSTAMLVVISLASSYLYGSASDLSVIYGSLTVLFTFLYAVYLSAGALLLGAAYAAALSEPPRPPGPPLPRQVREAILGLFRRPPEHDPASDREGR
jgi:membrane protein